MTSKSIKNITTREDTRNCLDFKDEYIDNRLHKKNTLRQLQSNEILGKEEKNMMVLCAKCKTMFDCQEPVCPNCGSPDRDIAISDVLDMYQKHFGVQDLSGETYSGKSKFFYEVKTKPDFDRDTQQNVMVERTFDRREDKDSYIEEIKTKSGEVIKRNTDKLSEHKGHGSDKTHPRNSGDDDGN
ncbi:hypothetical protein [Dysosmobacter sp.]|uniref:hypothetical protein n=1 Tax=Dysosmobacter sp. TaxID=2591382 RepID=UPI003AF093F0